MQSVAITGPFNPTGAGDTPSRRRIFVCRPASVADEDELACAKKILSTLARRAYRRPLSDSDLETLIGFYESGRRDANFDAGIEQALARVLIDPRFVFRFEREPARYSRRRHLSHQRSGTRLAPFVFPLEQHSG